PERSPMLPVLLALWSAPAEAAPPTAEEAEFWRLIAERGEDVPGQVAAREVHPWTNRRAGGDLLEVSQFGNVVVMEDESGEFFNTALSKIFSDPNGGFEWFFGSFQEAF